MIAIVFHKLQYISTLTSAHATRFSQSIKCCFYLCDVLWLHCTLEMPRSLNRSRSHPHVSVLYGVLSMTLYLCIYIGEPWLPFMSYTCVRVIWIFTIIEYCVYLFQCFLTSLWFTLSLPFLSPTILILTSTSSHQPLSSFHLLPLSYISSSPLTLFQMFDHWFSGSGPNGSGLSSELTSEFGSDLGSVFSSESSSVSGSGLDFVSAWGSGEVYCLLWHKRQKYSQKPVYWSGNRIYCDNDCMIFSELLVGS